MGLENLKSAFSDIDLNVPKQTTVEEQVSTENKSDGNIDLTTMVSKYSIQNHPQEVDYFNNKPATGFTANQNVDSPSLFTNVAGQETWDSTTGLYTIDNIDFPGPVDWMENTKAEGFTLNHQYPNSLYVGVGEGGSDWANTQFHTNSDSANHPGPVNFVDQNQLKASGFTLNQYHKAPSLFQGIEGTEPDTSWNNNVAAGGSLYSITSPGPLTDPQEVNYVDIPNNKALGFTAKMGLSDLGTQFIGIDEDSNEWAHTTSMYTINGITFGNDVDFMDNKSFNSYYSPVETAAIIPGFSSNFNTGGYTYAVGTTGNSKYINPEDSTLSIEAGAETSWTDSALTLQYQKTVGVDFMDNTGFTGFTPTMTTTNLQGISDDGVNWNELGEDASIDTSLTSLYFATINTDYTVNFNNTPGDIGVDFFGGNNSYFASIGSGSDSINGVPGFHIGYNPVFPGGFSAETPIGDTKYSGIPSWIAFGPQSEGSQFSLENVVGYSTFLDNLKPFTDAQGNDIPSIGVNYFDGKSLHPASNTDGGFSISGFDRMYNPSDSQGAGGGWSVDNPEGDSKILGLWNREGYSNQVLTAMWTGKTYNYSYDSDGNFISSGDISFPGSTFNPPNFPGGWTEQQTLGSSNFYVDDSQTGITVINPNPYSEYQGMIPQSYTISNNPSEGTFYNFEQGGNLFSQLVTRLESSTGTSVNYASASKGSATGGQPSPQFNILYDNTAWNPTASELKYTGPNQPGSNMTDAREKFNPKSQHWNSGHRVGNTNSIMGFSLDALQLEQQHLQAYGNPHEPYIYDHVGNVDDADGGWSFEGFMPFTRLQKDAARIAKFLSSPAGDNFIVNQEIMAGYQLFKGFYDPGSTLLNVASPKEGLGLPMLNFTRDTGIAGALLSFAQATTYTEFLENRSEGLKMIDMAFPSDKTYAERTANNKPFAQLVLGTMEKWADGLAGMVFDSVLDSMNPKPTVNNAETPIPHQVAGINRESKVNGARNMQNHMDSRKNALGNLGKGDPYSLIPMSPQGFDTAGSATNAELGMPFYFRDLRDSNVVMFRAYIEGLSETLSPTWNSENYVGRSEPIYTYSSTEREINFTLKIFANTKDELNQLYNKINRLTSMTYPEYKTEQAVILVDQDNNEKTVNVGSIGDKLRMKSPLCKLKLGDLFGGTNEATELTGFIKSLSYTYPDNSPWEIEDGYQVPKYVECEIGYQVLHSTVPSLEFALKDQDSDNTFYGINRTINSIK